MDVFRDNDLVLIFIVSKGAGSKCFYPFCALNSALDSFQVDERIQFHFSLMQSSQ